MKFASRVALALQLVGLAAPTARLGAQDACPRASGPDAEAGWAAYTAGEMERAESHFEAALDRCPEDDYARTGLGYVLLRAGDVTGATQLWRAVVQDAPSNVDALVGLGLAAWRIGDLDEVRARFERVVQLVPDHATALEYLDRVEGAAAERERPPDAADAAWAEGDTELALELYLARLGTNPEDDTARLRVALMLAWRGQYDDAIELLDDLVAQRPTHVDARLARARVRAWSGAVATAQREILEVLAVQPDHREALEALGLFQAWSGDVDGALETYDELISIAPESGVAGSRRAQALAWGADLAAAATAYEALLARDPDDVDARLGLAQTLAYAQDFDGALAEYDRVLASSPAELRALTGKATVLGWAGRLVEAERVVVEALAVDDASAAAWAALGQVYRWQGRAPDALSAFEAAAGLAPADPEIRDQLRSVGLGFAPDARPSLVLEDDSDGNLMLTTSAAGSWHPTPRLQLRARVYHKSLEQRLGTFTLERAARGLRVSAAFQLSPGWTFSTGVGGSTTSGTGDPSFLSGEIGVRTPERHDLVGTLTVSTSGLDETAVLAERGVRSSEVLASARWMPGPAWRFDASVGVGEYRGTEANGRRSAALGASRRLGRALALGVGLRGFSFEKNLFDGYFDPDFYGLAELTGSWLHRPGSWTFVVELAPGLQKVTLDGDVGTSLRSNARAAYALGPGREIGLSLGYSSAGLTSFATGGSGYSYTAVILSASWAF